MEKTIRELAKEMHCSYEAVRQHTKRYEKELEGHIIQRGKSQYLDEYACEFIRGKRLENPVTVQTIERDEAYEDLKEKYLNLLEDSKALEREYREYVTNAATLLQTASRQIALVETSEENKKRADDLEAKNRDLSADNEKKDKSLAELETKLKNASGELTEALDRESALAKRTVKAENERNEIEAKLEEYEAEVEAYAELPAWKRLFVKPPKRKNKE